MVCARTICSELCTLRRFGAVFNGPISYDLASISIRISPIHNRSHSYSSDNFNEANWLDKSMLFKASNCLVIWSDMIQLKLSVVYNLIFASTVWSNVWELCLFQWGIRLDGFFKVNTLEKNRMRLASENWMASDVVILFDRSLAKFHFSWNDRLKVGIFVKHRWSCIQH